MFKTIGKFFERIGTDVVDKAHEDEKTDAAIATAIKDDDPAETLDLELPHIEHDDC